MAIRFEILTDLKMAEDAWKKLSPEKSLFDDWNFRMCFHKYYKKELYFLAGFLNDELIGLLPLQYDDAGNLEFWCGNYMEDNRLFIKPEHENAIPEFYEYLRSTGKKVKLEYIAGTDPFTSSLTVQDHKYILQLNGVKSGFEYIEKYYNPKSQRRLRTKIRQIDRLGVKVTRNEEADLEKLFEYSIAAFGADSSFVCRPHHKEIFRELIKLPFNIFLLGFTVNGLHQGVSLSILYKNRYVYLAMGMATERESNLSAFIHMTNIEKAAESGATLVDGLVGDYNWKEKWYFEKNPQYKFEI